MKKVLYVATVDIHIKSFHLPYLKMLKDMGYEVHVATNGDEQFPYCDKKHIICIERSPFKFKNIKAIKQLRKIINKEKYDIVHCHTPMGSVVARFAAKKVRKNGTKVIYTAHGFHFFKGASLINWLFFYPVEKYLSKYTDVLITINKEDYNLAKRKFKKTNVEYIPGVGIDVEKFNVGLTEKEKNSLKKKLNLEKNDFILTCVARLDKNKNQSFLIDVVENLIRKHSDIHLLLVGNDELNGLYQQMVKDKKLEENIHFLGRRDDIPQILAISNVVLSASKREGLPVNVIEAFASGVPVVALNCRGMEDLIENGKNGYVVGLNSVNKQMEYVNLIDKLYDNNVLYNKIKSNNILKSNKYDVEKIKNLYKKIYLNKL